MKFVFIFLLAVIVYRVNPHLYLYSQDYSQILSHPPIPPPIVYQEIPADENLSPTFMYRGEFNRSGSFSGWIQKFKKTAQWNEWSNQDHHTASKATPAVDESGVYLGIDKGRMIAFKHDGKIKWIFHASDADRGIHSTPILTQKYIFFGAYNGHFYCLNKETGQILWQALLGKTIGSSPVFYEDAIYVGVETFHPDGYLVKIDARNGQLLWVSAWLGEQTHSSPTLDLENQQVILGDNLGQVSAFDLQSGRLRWRFKTQGPVKGTSPLWQGVVYYASWDGSLYALQAKTGELLWRGELGGKVQSSMAISQKHQLGVIGADRGRLCVVDLLQKKISQCVAGGSEGAMKSSPIVVGDDQVVASCRDQKSICVYSLPQLQRVAEEDLQDTMSSTPVIFNQSIYAVTNGAQGLLILEAM